MKKISLLAVLLLLGCIGDEISCNIPLDYEKKDLSPDLSGYTIVYGKNITRYIQATSLAYGIEPSTDELDVGVGLANYEKCLSENADVNATLYYRMILDENDNIQHSMVGFAIADMSLDDKSKLNYMGLCGGLALNDLHEGSCRRWATLTGKQKTYPNVVIGFDKTQDICSIVMDQILEKGQCE